jgi:hypothetical protein
LLVGLLKAQIQAKKQNNDDINNQNSEAQNLMANNKSGLSMEKIGACPHGNKYFCSSCKKAFPLSRLQKILKKD